MKAVLISIKPKWCELIASGKKTVEVRKNRPKLETPFKCYIYCTKGSNDLIKGDIATTINYVAKNSGKVIGEFVCDGIYYWGYTWLPDMMHLQDMSKLSCVSDDDLLKYSNGAKDKLYGWHISDLVIYDEPQPLNWFVTEGDCDCMNCRECSWFNRGNGYNVEDDCDLGYENIRVKKALKPLFRPPQSWCYVEDLGGV